MDPACMLFMHEIFSMNLNCIATKNAGVDGPMNCKKPLACKLAGLKYSRSDQLRDRAIGVEPSDVNRRTVPEPQYNYQIDNSFPSVADLHGYSQSKEDDIEGSEEGCIKIVLLRSLYLVVYRTQ